MAPRPLASSVSACDSLCFTSRDSLEQAQPDELTPPDEHTPLQKVLGTAPDVGRCSPPPSRAHT